ncbi:unnamed protein product [Prorocentrum cordatum]|uniref:Uncharacterized protein n=1 Tax=Prorocentrum cordatum TaxID=2364126 RepID=A0ABN9W770_9DINO|nr:unnamed protein product [Polarella glacialis]CAK0882033.1 unnamed protein product [Polarella glacialis]
MARLAGDNLPAVIEQRPRPALAWAAASSAAPAPRQLWTPRMARGRPHGGDRCGVVLGPDRIRRPSGLHLPEISVSPTLTDLPYMRRPESLLGICRSRRLVVGVFTAPELLSGVELTSSGAVGNQTSDPESTSVLSVEPPMPSEACDGLRRTSAMAGQDERPPADNLGAAVTTAGRAVQSPAARCPELAGRGLRAPARPAASPAGPRAPFGEAAPAPVPPPPRREGAVGEGGRRPRSAGS